jgi:hypothetical protein
MSDIHYFQRYNQKENVVTNNTLLLCSRLYAYSSSRFDAFLNSIISDYNIDSGVHFVQQSRGKKGNTLPDGMISQNSFKIIIETKLKTNQFDVSQLVGHLESFENENQKILFALSPTIPPISKITEIKKEVSKFNQNHNTNIHFIAATFEDIITGFNDILFDMDFQMQELINDYQQFCSESSLLPTFKYKMRALVCGSSLSENINWGLYYAPSTRGYQEHQYIGFYDKKAIKGIGKIENIVIADLIDGNLIVHDSKKALSEDEKERIIGAVNMAYETKGWDISKYHKFFLVDKFHETSFRKTTKFPLQSSKYFNLKHILNIDKLPKTEKIADLLKKIVW